MVGGVGGVGWLLEITVSEQLSSALLNSAQLCSVHGYARVHTSTGICFSLGALVGKGVGPEGCFGRSA